MTGRIVDKIGGSSMAWPVQAMDIVKSTTDKRIVVVSAPGADIVRDRPLRMTEMLKSYEQTGSEQVLDAIRGRMYQIGRRGLLLDHTIRRVVPDIGGDIARAQKHDEPVDPLGETWMAKLFAEMLGSQWRYLPASELLQFGADGALDMNASRAVAEQLDPALNYVVDGNQGSSDEGKILRIGDGGSDVSAAYVRAVLGRGILRLHSDVDGYKTVDPNMPLSDDIVRVQHDVPYVTYREASQLGKAGNGLVHPGVARILRGSGSRTELFAARTGLSGTVLADERPNVHEQPVVGVTGERKVVKVHWHKDGSEDEIGATLDFREDLKTFAIPLHSTTTDDDSESVYTAQKHADKVEKAFRDNPNVTISPDMASVTIVGEGLVARRTEFLAKAFMALERYSVPVDSVTSDGISMTVFIPRQHYHAAVDSIHADIIGL